MNKTSIASLIIIPLALIIGIFYFGSELINGQVANVDAIEFTQTETLILDPGNETDLEYTITPTDAEDQTVTFTSSDETVVSVTEVGHIVALSYGTAIITVTTTDGGLTSNVTVIVSERLVTGVDLLKTEATLIIGEDETLEYTLSPDGALNRVVNWTSSDESVATVNANGKVVAVSKGTATITITTSTDTDTGLAYTDTLELTVQKDIQSLSFNQDNIQTITNDIDLNALLSINPADVSAELALVKYTLSAEVGTITDGVLHFNSASEVIVTVESLSNPTLTDTITIKYTDGYPLDITVDRASLYIDIYSSTLTGQITATIDPSSGVVAPKDAITWTSSDESVATVDSNGLVTALAIGSTTITAETADGLHSDTTLVTVGTSFVAVESVTLDAENVNLNVTDIYKLTATVEGVGSENPTFTGIVWNVMNSASSFKYYADNNGVKGDEILFLDLGDYRGAILYVESLNGGAIDVTATSADNTTLKTDTATFTTNITPTYLSFTGDDIVGFDDEIQLAWEISSTQGNIYPTSNSDVTFTIVGGSSIASVNANGLLTFSSVGMVTIEVKSVATASLTDTITVTYANYELEDTAKEITSGGNYTIIAEGKSGDTYDFTDGYTLSVPAGSTYSASDIVTEEIVNGNLKLTGINHGTVIVTITAADGVFLDDERTFTLNVTEGPASIVWPLTSSTVPTYYVGTSGTVPLSYTLLGLDPSDIFDEAVTLTFTDAMHPLLTSSEIATISNNEITFLGEGVVTLTITSDRNPAVSASFTYTVNDGYNVDTEAEIQAAIVIKDAKLNLVGDIFISGVNRDVFMTDVPFSFFGNGYTIDASDLDIKYDDTNAQGIFALTLVNMTAVDVVNFQDLTIIGNTGYELGYRDMGTPDTSDDMYDGSRSIDIVQVTVVDMSRLGALNVTDCDFSGGWVNTYIRHVDVATFTRVDLTNAYCDSLYAESNALIRLIDSTLGTAGYSAVDLAAVRSLISNPDGIEGNGDDIVQTLSVEGTTTLTNWIPADATQSVFMRGEADYTLIYSMFSSYILQASSQVMDVSTGTPMVGLSVTIFSQNIHTPVTTGTPDYALTHNYSTVSTDMSAGYNTTVVPVYQIVESIMGTPTAIAYGFDPASPTIIVSEKPDTPLVAG